MASKEFNVVAILYPKKGKTDEVGFPPPMNQISSTDDLQVLSLMKDVAENTKNNEPGVLSYSITRSLRPNKDGTEEIVMLEK